MYNKYKKYKEIDINTTNRGRIVVMLFSGAINFLKKAKQYAEDEDFYNRGKYISKAQDIIDELNYSLDLRKGKEIARNLRSLYLFMNRFLSNANISNDTKKIDRVIEMLNSLKDAFDEVVKNSNDDETKMLKKREMVKNSIKRYV